MSQQKARIVKSVSGGKNINDFKVIQKGNIY